MDGDFSCESAFTINKMSSVLSTFIADKISEKTLTHSVKRALTYSLIR